MKYVGSRGGADIHATMVGGDRRRGGKLCVASSRDGISIRYWIGDSGPMPSDSHCWPATMDGGGGGHGLSPWSRHLGQVGADTLARLEPTM